MITSAESELKIDYQKQTFYQNSEQFHAFSNSRSLISKGVKSGLKHIHQMFVYTGLLFAKTAFSLKDTLRLYFFDMN